MNIIVGTRGSTLALSQTLLLVNQLKAHHRNIHFEIKIIKTKGDQNQTTPLHKMNDKGIFVKEIESELIHQHIDFAVHSMKDMPSEMDERLDFPVISQREDPRDVLILRSGLKETDLKQMDSLRIGTGSKRRAYQLKEIYPKVSLLPIRGNIDTRIRKIQTENLDGIVLAASGLKRIDREEEISLYFSPQEMLPAPCQGMLAIQTRKNDLFIRELLSVVSDEKTSIQYRAERAFLKEIQGGCHLPIGAYCEVYQDQIKLFGLFGDEEGSKLHRAEMHGLAKEAESIGRALAVQLKKMLEEKNE